jgi:hypothetical protein
MLPSDTLPAAHFKITIRTLSSLLGEMTGQREIMARRIQLLEEAFDRVQNEESTVPPSDDVSMGPAEGEDTGE